MLGSFLGGGRGNGDANIPNTTIGRLSCLTEMDGQIFYVQTSILINTHIGLEPLKM